MENKINIENIFKKKGFYIIPLFFLLFSFGSDFYKFFVLSFFLPLFVFVLVYSKKYFQEKTLHLYTYEKIIGLFVLLSFFASILSNNKFSSFFGDYHNHVFSFISIFAFISFFLFLARLKGLFSQKDKFLRIFFYSSIAIFFYQVAASFFPTLDVFKFRTEDLLIIATINILLFAPLLFKNIFSKKEGGTIKYSLLILLFLISVVFYKPLFFVFIIVYLVQLFLLDKKIFRSVFKKRISFLILLVFLFGAVLSIDSDKVYKINESSLSRTASFKIVSSVLKTDFLFGKGFGSYSDYFSLHRPAELNYDDNWQIRFNNSHSFICNLPIAVGFLATLSFLFFIFFLFYVAYISFRTYNKDRDDSLFVSLLGAFLFLSTLPFLITFSYLSFFLYWFFLALFVNFVFKKRYYKSEEFLIKNKSNIFLVIFYLGLFIWLFFVAFNVKFLLADFYANKSDEVSIKKAVLYNPHFEEYDISLSRIYLEKAKIELNKANKDYGGIARDVDEAKKWAETAMQINLNSVAAYETLGIIYRDIANYSSNGEIFALTPLKKAFSLEPTNPVLATEIGKLYLIQKENENALKYFNIAYSLKKDYKEAGLGLARVMIANNNNREAIQLLNKIQEENFNDAKVYFELGRAYFGMNNNELAIDNFLKSLLFEPNNSNALYSLAVTYEKIGDKESAFLYYKKTQELNPGNLELMKKINEIGE